MSHSAYIVEEEDSEGDRILALEDFNRFIEWSMLSGARPSPIFFSRSGPSIFERIAQMPIQGEFFPEPDFVRWVEDEYIPIPLPIK